jgi:hypothetical protein
MGKINMKRLPRKIKKIIKQNNLIYRFDKEMMEVLTLAFTNKNYEKL